MEKEQKEHSFFFTMDQWHSSGMEFYQKLIFDRKIFWRVSRFIYMIRVYIMSLYGFEFRVVFGSERRNKFKFLFLWNSRSAQLISILLVMSMLFKFCSMYLRLIDTSFKTFEKYQDDAVRTHYLFYHWLVFFWSFYWVLMSVKCCTHLKKWKGSLKAIRIFKTLFIVGEVSWAHYGWYINFVTYSSQQLWKVQ